MMKKPIAVDDSMSNLTSASNEASISSGNRDEIFDVHTQQPFLSSSKQTQPASGKKRNLPGNPDPEAEVLALSPTTLLTTNRFVCEICNKGFKRDQNLQLHRRGHNLPWKLKQRSNKEVIRKKVYVCPEPTCVHHDPSRALGDLTGIKKHFSRKHGEKKWKCEKCSKRYAVQSDWKAHSKICGTREYRCDCGTIFSRRDSFITHRAFCDALADEGARVMITSQQILYSQPGSSSIQLNLQNQLPGYGGFPMIFPLKREQDLQESFTQLTSLPPTMENGSGPLPSEIPSNFLRPRLDQSIMHYENSNPTPMLSSLLPTAAASPHMSATAMLQKAAQMGVTMSKPTQSKTMPLFRPHQVHMTTPPTGLSSTSLATSIAGSSLVLSSSEEVMGARFVNGLASFGNKDVVNPSSFMEQMVSSTAFLSTSHGFEGLTFGGTSRDELPKPQGASTADGSGSGNDGLTRDFLGLTAYPDRDCFYMADFHHIDS